MVQTGYGKTTFVKNVWRHRLCRLDLKIELDEMKEHNIRSCFYYTIVNFYYPDNISNFNVLIETFQSENTQTVDDDNSCNIFGEKKLINFLSWMTPQVWLINRMILVISWTVSRKFGYICLYIFHTLYLSKSIW